MSSPSDEPLLPTFRDRPAVDAAVRESLEVLRDQADDPAVRDRITAVLESRASLRDLARDDDFGAFLTPYAEEGWRHFEALSPEERERLADEV